MARLPENMKIEKVVSRDKTRPIMTHPGIVEWGEGKAIAATDSYKLVVVPLADADRLEVGPIDLDSVKRAVKSPSGEITSEDGRTEVRDGNGTSSVANIGGQFPNAQQLFPDASAYDKHDGVREIGLNAKYLYELAQSMGNDVVRVKFLSPLRPMVVTPEPGRKTVQGAQGLLMPVRLEGI